VLTVTKPVRVGVTLLASASLMGGAAAAQARTARSSSAAAGLAYAKAEVAQYSNKTGVPTAGPAIKGGIKSLKGKKVWWIPDATAIPYFAAVLQGAKAAAAAAGIKLEVCDGNSTPTAMSACIQDAINEGGAGVVGDGFDVSQVQQAVNSLEAHHIPFVQGDLTQQPGNDKIAYVWNNSFLQAKLAADAVIAQTKGKGNILLIRQTDSPTTEAFVDQGGLPQLKQHCPDCKVTIIQTNFEQLSQLTSAVSSALEKNPNIDAIYAEFDLEGSSVLGALQSLNKKIPVYSTTALLSGLQLIADGKGEVADAGTDPAYMGWAGVDQVMRMMLKKPVNNTVPMPVRLFDTANVKSLALTNTAFNTGAWYGATGFQKMFEHLWGV
jgi:ribose transport system substrate-binding protein